jgi:hypothetical protein
MENRNGIVIELRVGPATGRAEREQALRCCRSLAARAPDHGRGRQSL